MQDRGCLQFAVTCASLPFSDSLGPSAPDEAYSRNVRSSGTLNLGYEGILDLIPLSRYRNDPKFSDRYAWANSADPDQTAPRGAV